MICRRSLLLALLALTARVAAPLAAQVPARNLGTAENALSHAFTEISAIRELPDGRVVQRVTLPGDSRIVGFGVRAVYVVRVDEDELEYLQPHMTNSR